MIPGIMSLALGTVVFRRFFDSATGRIPVLPASTGASVPTMIMCSAALFYLCNHLRKGTLVNIGRRVCGSSTNNIALHRPNNNNSWFFKNLWGKRKSCTDAIFRVAKQFSDSVTNLNPCLVLPKQTFQVSFPNESLTRATSAPRIPDETCEVIFNNDDYERELPTSTTTNRMAVSLVEVKRPFPNACGDNGAQTNKKSKRSIVKRLGRGNGPKVVSSKSSTIPVERRTRSGRVYNPFK